MSRPVDARPEYAKCHYFVQNTVLFEHYLKRRPGILAVASAFSDYKFGNKN